MGVKGLYNYLRPYRESFDPRNEQSKRIGVDAMSLLYKHRGRIDDILILLQSLKQVGHRIFFVFDGKPPVEKEREVQARKDQKSAAETKRASLQAFLQTEEFLRLDPPARKLLEETLKSLELQSWHMTREIRRKFQGELWKAEISYVKSLSEADDVLVDLVHGGKLDVIMTTDMDYLLSGAPVLWIPTHRGLFEFEKLSLQVILKGEGLTLKEFTEVGLLCGTEERARAKGIPCKMAMTLVRYYGSIEGVLASSLNDPTLHSMFPDQASILSARETLEPREMYSRIRPDHLERVKDFLESL
jgi:5'-3' exonuclease